MNLKYFEKLKLRLPTSHTNLILKEFQASYVVLAYLLNFSHSELKEVTRGKEIALGPAARAGGPRGTEVLRSTSLKIEERSQSAVNAHILVVLWCRFMLSLLQRCKHKTRNTLFMFLVLTQLSNQMTMCVNTHTHAHNASSEASVLGAEASRLTPHCHPCASQVGTTGRCHFCRLQRFIHAFRLSCLESLDSEQDGLPRWSLHYSS